MVVVTYERIALSTLPDALHVPFGFFENRVKELPHPELDGIFVLPTRTEAARLAAEHILDVVKNKPDAAISFPTGNQAKSVYEQLTKLSKERGISLADVKAYHLDEYFPIDATHPDSFRRYLRENVWGPLEIKPENIHEIQADPGTDGNAVAAAYEALLSNTPIDLVLHPIGCGGHMGFNEKGTPKTSVTHLAKLSDETIYRDQVERKQTSPDYAISQGIATIKRAEKILFIDLDPKYQDDFKEALCGPISEQNPSSLLRENKTGTVIAITTADIASHIGI